MQAASTTRRSLAGSTYTAARSVYLSVCVCPSIHLSHILTQLNCIAVNQILLDYEAYLFDSKALSTFSFDSIRGCFFLSDGSAGGGGGGVQEASPGHRPGQGQVGQGRRPCPVAIHHAGRKEQLSQFRSAASYSSGHAFTLTNERS